MIIGERDDVTEDFTLRRQLADMFVLMRRHHKTFCMRVVAPDRTKLFDLHGKENHCYVHLLTTLFGFDERRGTGEPDLSQFAWQPNAVTPKGRRVVRKELAKKMKFSEDVLKLALRRLEDRGIIKRQVIKYTGDHGGVISELYIKLDVNTLRTFVYRQNEEEVVVVETAAGEENSQEATVVSEETPSNIGKSDEETAGKSGPKTEDSLWGKVTPYNTLIGVASSSASSASHVSATMSSAFITGNDTNANMNSAGPARGHRNPSGFGCSATATPNKPIKRAYVDPLLSRIITMIENQFEKKLTFPEMERLNYWVYRVRDVDLRLTPTRLETYISARVHGYVAKLGDEMLEDAWQLKCDAGWLCYHWGAIWKFMAPRYIAYDSSAGVDIEIIRDPKAMTDGWVWQAAVTIKTAKITVEDYVRKGVSGTASANEVISRYVVMHDNGMDDEEFKQKHAAQLVEIMKAHPLWFKSLEREGYPIGDWVMLAEVEKWVDHNFHKASKQCAAEAFSVLASIQRYDASEKLIGLGLLRKV